ncbi:hypothetical protein HPB49_026432 [Dermacentor silvarum]|nr:hypothetical protein HPB49_026432 [Dermacentor silvarum]
MSKVLTYVDPLIASLDTKDLASLAHVVGEAQCNASNTLKLIRERARQLRASTVCLAAHSLVMGPRLQQPERQQLESSLCKLLEMELSHRSVVDFADIVTWLPITSFDLLTTFWNLAADLSNPSLGCS